METIDSKDGHIYLLIMVFAALAFGLPLAIDYFEIEYNAIFMGLMQLVILTICSSLIVLLSDIEYTRTAKINYWGKPLPKTYLRNGMAYRLLACVSRDQKGALALLENMDGGILLYDLKDVVLPNNFKSHVGKYLGCKVGNATELILFSESEDR